MFKRVFSSVFTAALVDEHQFGDAGGVVRIFDEVHFKLMLQKFGHRLVDEFIGDRLFGLVFIRRPCVENEDDTSTRQSCTSVKLIFPSFFRYLLFC